MTGRTGGPAPSGASAGLQAPAATTTAPHSTDPGRGAHAGHAPALVLDRLDLHAQLDLADRRGERARGGARVGLPVAVGAGSRRRCAATGRAPGGGSRPAPATRRRARATAGTRAGGAAPRRRRGRRPRSARRCRGSRSAARCAPRARRRTPASARARPGSRAPAAPRRSRPPSPARACRRPRARRPSPGVVRAVDDEHGQAALARAPGAGEADQAGTDDNGVVACAPRQLESPSLRRHYPGQVRRSAAPQPPSQPGFTRAPVGRPMLHLLSIRSPTAPQLSKRVLFRPGTGARCSPSAAPFLVP